MNPSQSAAALPPAHSGLCVCLGTRPEIIKMAPVIDALDRRGVRPDIIHTGQHDDLAWPLYEYFGLEPAIELKRAAESRTLSSLSAGLLGSLDAALTQSQPRAVLVHGDTTTAAMAALAAFYRGIPIAHVEAGLRSHQLDDPFPEEFNRSLIARVARWHFAPTEHAVRNLYREGVEAERTFLVGNTIVDATLRAIERMKAEKAVNETSTALASSATRPLPVGAGLEQGNDSSVRTVLVTLHRRENWGSTIAAIARGVFALVQAHPDLQIIWPLHANAELAQQVRDQLQSTNGDVRRRCHLLAPLDYPDLMEVLASAWLVITDSGGLQEEACALKVPVLVTRQGTERPELIEVGAGRLVGTDPLNLIREFERLWRDPARHEAMRNSRNPFGDGRASDRIAAVLAEWLNERSVGARSQDSLHALSIKSWPEDGRLATRFSSAAALLRPMPQRMAARNPNEAATDAAATVSGAPIEPFTPVAALAPAGSDSSLAPAGTRASRP